MKEVKVEGLERYNELEARITEVTKELKRLWEDKKAIERDTEQAKKKASDLKSAQYDCGDEVVARHKFWSDEGGHKIGKIIRVPDSCFSLAYILTQADGYEHEFHTSSIGFLMNFPVPITEEDYNEIYDKFKNN